MTPDRLYELITATLGGWLRQDEAVELANGLTTEAEVIHYGQRASCSPLTVEYARSLDRLLDALDPRATCGYVVETGAKRGTLSTMMGRYWRRWTATDLLPRDINVRQMEWDDAVRTLDPSIVYMGWPVAPRNGVLDTIVAWLEGGWAENGRTLIVAGATGVQVPTDVQGVYRTVPWSECPEWRERLKGRVTPATDLVPGFVDLVPWRHVDAWSVVQTLVVQ